MTIKRRRLNLNVKSDFQRWLLWRILGIIALSALLAGAILYLYARQETASNFYSAHLQLRRVSDLLLPVILAGTSVSLISGVVLALFLPQKIAGPLFNLERTLGHVRQGALNQHMQLRKHDCLQDMAKQVNLTLATINGELQQARHLHNELCRAVQAQSPVVVL